MASLTGGVAPARIERAGRALRTQHTAPTVRDRALAQLGIGPGGGLHPGRLAVSLLVVAAALVAGGDRSGAGLLVGGVDLAAALVLRVRPGGRRVVLVAPALLALTPAALTLAGRPGGGVLLPTVAAAYLGLCARPGDTARAVPFLLVTTAVAGGLHPAALAADVVAWLLVGEVTARARQGAHRLLSEARRAAETDPLTGLGNRRRLDDALAVLPPGGVLVLVDLDHFKAYNDRWGHPAGDRLLARFADVLRSVTGPGEIVCRYGGEEFVVVLPDPAEAATLFLRLRREWESSAPVVTFSAGLAARRAGEPGGETLARADSALYDAKRGGRDRAEGPVLVPGRRTPARPMGAAADRPR